MGNTPMGAPLLMDVFIYYPMCTQASLNRSVLYTKAKSAFFNYLFMVMLFTFHTLVNAYVRDPRLLKRVGFYSEFTCTMFKSNVEMY